MLNRIDRFVSETSPAAIRAAILHPAAPLWCFVVMGIIAAVILAAEA
jgi:hypothetical protein